MNNHKNIDKKKADRVMETLRAVAKDLYSHGGTGQGIPAGHDVVGSCSLCGGPVTVPSAWLSVTPPTPSCASCGAIRAGFGRVIDMQPSPRTRISTATTGFDLDSEFSHKRNAS